MYEKMEAILKSKAITEICRLCLTDECILQDLFENAIPDSKEGPPSLLEKITDSTSIKIIEADEFPTKVCCECCEQIEKIHKFKQKCLAADSLLQKHVRLKPQLKAEEYEPSTSFSPSESFQGAENLFLEEDGVGADVATDYPLVSDTVDGKLFKYDSEMLLEVNIKEEGGENPNDCGTSNNEEVSPNTVSTKSKKRFSNSSKPQCKISSKGTKYICQLCGKHFCNKYSLTRHKWSHSKQTTACPYCNKMFKNRESLIRHEKMHQEGNRYQCHMCDKSYVSSTSHAAHIRKHTGERPFKCSDCDETFYLISSFERHVAKHRGMKEYECEICSASFWVPDDLRAHVNRMH